MSGRDKDGVRHEFYYERETRIRQSLSEIAGRPLFVILEASGPNFPLQRGQEILVTWKPYPKLPGKRLALRIAVEPLR